MECAIEALENMERKGIGTIDIYYVEDIDDGSIKWSVDVMNDELNNLCNMNWTWTIISFDEFKFRLEDSLIYVCADFEIIVDRFFSNGTVCDAINVWLENNNINIKTKMVDIEKAEGSGYFKTLKNRLVKSK